jgi:RimJ/RimL family protein N-acetyltransferase
MGGSILAGMSQPLLPIPGARLTCRWWTTSDLPLARLLWGDQRVTRYVAGPWSEEQIASRLLRYIGYQEQHGYTYWPWFSRADGGFVGVCGLKPAPPAEGCPGEHVLETGFYLRPQFHRQGFGREMARAVIAHAFGALGCTALWAGCHPDNTASAGLLADLGFQRHGTEFYEPIRMDQPTFLLRRAIS